MIAAVIPYAGEPIDVLVEVDPAGPTEGQIAQALAGAYAEAWQ